MSDKKLGSRRIPKKKKMKKKKKRRSKVNLEEQPFPGADATSEQLLSWLSVELLRKRIGSARLMGLMDENRSGTISLREFEVGLEHVDVDMERPGYMALFKAVDVSGDRSVTMEELKEHLYVCSVWTW